LKRPGYFRKYSAATKAAVTVDVVADEHHAF
jgi:hypothetical protein